MKNFDLNMASKKMPYAPLPEESFQKLNAETMARIEKEIARSRVKWRIFISTYMAVAASVVFIIASLLVESSTERAIGLFDSDLEIYVEALSDEELTSSYYNTESNEEFYANL